jgi:hypothetical protein
LDIVIKTDGVYDSYADVIKYLLFDGIDRFVDRHKG